MSKTTKVWLKSKLGRPFWRFGVQLSPDTWTEFDLTDAQLKEISPQFASVAEGGALEIMREPPAKPEPAAKPAEPAPDKSKK